MRINPSSRFCFIVCRHSGWYGLKSLDFVEKIWLTWPLNHWLESYLTSLAKHRSDMWHDPVLKTLANLKPLLLRPKGDKNQRSKQRMMVMILAAKQTISSGRVLGCWCGSTVWTTWTGSFFEDFVINEIWRKKIAWNGIVFGPCDRGSSKTGISNAEVIRHGHPHASFLKASWDRLAY